METIGSCAVEQSTESKTVSEQHFERWLNSTDLASSLVNTIINTHVSLQSELLTVAEMAYRSGFIGGREFATDGLLRRSLAGPPGEPRPELQRDAKFAAIVRGAL